MATKAQRRARRNVVVKLPQFRVDVKVGPPKPGEDHMAEANALVNGDRQAAYGSPFDSYEAQAKVWSGLLADKLKADLTAEDVVILLAGMKLRRQAHKPKRDNVVDTHGYMLVLAHVEAERAKRGGDLADLIGLRRTFPFTFTGIYDDKKSKTSTRLRTTKKRTR